MNHFSVILLLPTKKEQLYDYDDMHDEDMFNFWIATRRRLNNYHSERLCVGLKLIDGEMDEEFTDPTMYSRWKGEPLNLFVLTADSFQFSPSPPILHSKISDMTLSHKTLVTDLCTVPDVQKFLLAPDCQIWPNQRKQIAEYLTALLTETMRNHYPQSEENWDISMHDRLSVSLSYYSSMFLLCLLKYMCF